MHNVPTQGKTILEMVASDLHELKLLYLGQQQSFVAILSSLARQVRMFPFNFWAEAQLDTSHLLSVELWLVTDSPVVRAGWCCRDRWHLAGKPGL
jgi:hypothetical protein